jgi:hypothetical protein
MKLLNEIIDAATDTTQPVANILRKCLILAFELKNEKLKAWVEGELNGLLGLQGELYGSVPVVASEPTAPNNDTGRGAPQDS